MTDSEDRAPVHALTVLAGVIALVVGGVLALAVWRGSPGHGAVQTAATLDEPQGRICFAIASSALPATAQDVLGPVADAARADPGKIVLISGWQDGNAGESAERAAQRAEAVRHALEADGVAADKLVVDPPLRTAGRDTSCVGIRVH